MSDKGAEEKVWTVEESYDRVIARKRSVLEAEDRRYIRTPLHLRFSTEVDAWQFCVDRAGTAADKANARHNKCRKRLKKALGESA